MKYFRRSQSVNVLCLCICLDQLLISGHMCKNTQLNLRIIRIQKYIPLLRHKYLTDQASQFHSHRNILKIRLCAADPACCSNRLIKCRMYSSVFRDNLEKPVRISGFQFGKLTVLQNIFYNRMIRGQLVQNIRCCGISGFRFLSAFDSHFFKKDHSKLLRGIDVKFFPCLLPDQFLQFRDPHIQLLTVTLQLFSPDTDSPFFHGIQGKNKRKLNFRIHLPHSCFFQCFTHRHAAGKCRIRLITCQRSQSF